MLINIITYIIYYYYQLLMVKNNYTHCHISKLKNQVLKI